MMETENVEVIRYKIILTRGGHDTWSIQTINYFFTDFDL